MSRWSAMIWRIRLFRARNRKRDPAIAGRWRLSGVSGGSSPFSLFELTLRPGGRCTFEGRLSVDPADPEAFIGARGEGWYFTQGTLLHCRFGDAKPGSSHYAATGAMLALSTLPGTRVRGEQFTFRRLDPEAV